MKAANDRGPERAILSEGLDVEATALRLGLTENQIRDICRRHEMEILDRMKDSADDAIREIAFGEGLLSMGEPEIPEDVRRSIQAFAANSSVAMIEAYEDVPPVRIRVVDEDS